MDALALAADRLEEPEVDIFEKLGFVANPGPQTRFLELPDENLDVLYGGAAGGSKMQRVDEPVATPSGWTNMGDLQPGDEIFTETGAICRVTEIHPVDPRPVAYRLTFDDGTEMEACADHLWVTFDAKELAALTRRDPGWRERRRSSRPSRATGLRSPAFSKAITDRNQALAPKALVAPTGTVRTTKQIADTLLTARGHTNHAIPVAGALNLPHADLPVDPYVLGAWLGDGSSSGSGFTSADSEIIDEIRLAGVTVHDCRSDTAKYRYRLGDTVRLPRSNGRIGQVNTFAALLRRLGVLGDKHIPMAYLRSSLDQRMALIQGLMDTDGTANKAGQPSFTTTSPKLAEGMYELIVSLGWKVRLTERRAKLNGRDCGPMWTFKWSPDRIVFRLARKAERQVLATRRTTRFRYVVGCKEVDPTPMRCISVDNPTHLYLAGRSMVPTHNSTSLLMYALRSCVRYPGLQAFWFRRSFPELEQSVLRMLSRYGYAKDLGARYNGSTHELRFSNDSILTFGHAKNVQEVTALQSAEINLLLIDERTTIPPDVIDQLYIRVRSGVASVPCLGIRSATNPGGVGHSRVKANYVEATSHGEREVIDASNRRRVFIQARVTDTPQLGEQYRLNLRGLDEKLRKAFLDGDWDVFAGQMFAEWRYQRHVVEPFAIPETWRRYNGIDWGWSAPWCTLWAALDEDGRVWVYREIYATLVPEAEQAKQILSAEATDEYVVERFADDAMWASRGAEKSIAAVYEENGVHLTAAGKGSGSRINGWQRIHSYLADGPACWLHRSLGWEKCPMLHVFPQAENLIRTLPALPHAKKGNPEDADSDAEDHAPDGLRYLLMNIGNGPQFLTLPDPVDASSQIAPLPTIGGFAYRPAETEYGAGWLDDEETPVRGAVQRSPFI